MSGVMAMAYTLPLPVGLLEWCLLGSGDQGFSINEQLDIFSVGVDEGFEERGAKVLNISESSLPVQCVKNI